MPDPIIAETGNLAQPPVEPPAAPPPAAAPAPAVSPPAPPPREYTKGDRRWGVACVIYLLIAVIGTVALFIYTWPLANENTEVCGKVLGAISDLSAPASAGSSPPAKGDIDKFSELLRTKLRGRGLACPLDRNYMSTWLTLLISKDQALLILVAIAGGLGSLVYCLRSATWYLGNREFKSSWACWYFAQPLIGAALGAMVYLVFRAGFINPSSTEAVNPFGFLAIAGIVGLYTEQALTQLKLVAETVLKSPPKGKDPTEHK
jgi:hypothetical protein